MTLHVDCPRPGCWTLASRALAGRLGVEPAELGRTIRRHLEIYGSEYAAEGAGSIYRLTWDGGLDLIVISAELRDGMGRVLAVVGPDEQAAAERAVGALRRHLHASRLGRQ